MRSPAGITGPCPWGKTQTTCHRVSLDTARQTVTPLHGPTAFGSNPDGDLVSLDTSGPGTVVGSGPIS